MFTVEERDRVRARLLTLATSDVHVVAAAVTGSYAVGTSDEWSDIDLAFAIPGELPAALDHWTTLLDRDFGALHHWDLRSGSTIYRVFLLPGWLEVDIAFTPASEFGPLGPNWRTVFGETVELASGAPAQRDEIVGLAWHHLLHAHMCIERGKPWQALWLLNGARDQVFALGCRRAHVTTAYAKGVDLLARDFTAPLEATLVSSLDEGELRRVLAALGVELAAELDRTDPEFAAQLIPMLADFAAPSPKGD